MDGLKKVGRGLLTFVCIMPVVFLVVFATRNVLWINSQTAGDVGALVAAVCYSGLWLYRRIRGRVVSKWRLILVPLILLSLGTNYVRSFYEAVSQMWSSLATR